MNNIVIQRVTNSRQRKQFLELPWTIYRNDPYWIPPLRLDQKENVGYTHNPFYDRNQIQTFLAYRGGEVVGRIGAILNQGHINRYDDRRGFFGFFESIDDQEVANGLFNAARDWFADQGIFKLRGPTNPSLNGAVGLLIDGFDSSPTFMMTYNPRYYERLIENYGFRKTQDLYAFWGHISMLPKIAEKLRPIAEQIIERYNVKVRPLDKSRFREEVKSFLSIYNRSLTNTWGFVPMSDAEVEHVAKGLQLLIVPELAIFVEIDGRLVGACFGLLDYNPRIKEIDGRLFPFGFIHLLRKKSEIKKIRLISTNVLPEYQMQGLGLVLMHGIVPKAIEWGIAGGRVLLGAGIEQLLPRRPDQGRGQDHQDLSHLRHRLRSGRGRGPAANACGGPPSKGGWKSGRSSPAATSTPSSRCPGGSMPKIRSGCRSCCWTRKSSSIPACIPSICTGPPRNSSPTATACPRDASS